MTNIIAGAMIGVGTALSFVSIAMFSDDLIEGRLSTRKKVIWAITLCIGPAMIGAGIGMVNN
ncbi:hypothetical protein [Corynebacterium heidelbergense]|uniref:Uncharacterized protein n=1 Tax=Corynebacterium heidelbergense TaxID=2055947 RepID=A0A364VE63_9CORY|nr:hypothetical protein [Corynebacterium heidelbergense]RAV34911.1 hypothetical protein CWC39_00810 [Corynebacterium heidelbergense]WCZ36048.1 hypothetical protein CHEID_02410 [Corynebacterium heidelbergense]